MVEDPVNCRQLFRRLVLVDNEWLVFNGRDEIEYTIPRIVMADFKTVGGIFEAIINSACQAKIIQQVDHPDLGQPSLPHHGEKTLDDP
jgi:hypothetical protein